MAGYTRQSVADIIANAVIKAAPVNAEFNAIRDAFNNSTGHKHDGTSAEGTFVPLIADLDGNNKVVVDTVNNRIGIFSEVGGAAVEQVRIQDGAIVPVTDDDIDLGASGAEFKNLYIDGIGYIDSVVITGGTIDGTVIGGTTAAAGSFTTIGSTGNLSVGGNLSVTGTSGFTGLATIAVVDINSGSIDNTVIGSTTPLAGSFTTVSTTGQADLATVDINGGTIDNTVIGGSTAQAITGTLITASTGFTGDLTGAVTGNVAGNVTGNLTGNVTGNVTSTGTSSFQDVTVNGTLNMNAGTTATITNLTTPVNTNDAATKGYVDTSVANLVDSAPGTLDTLNELAAALGDDPDFATTITTSIATKLPLAGGTMTGPIAMGTSKITGLGDPTAAQDAATKNYSDTTFLALTGGTLTGAIDMGSSKITTTYSPTDAADLTTKTYVDAILGSSTSAAISAAAASASATNAATSASNAATSETNASNSATAASTSATNAATSYDSFDDRYLGVKSSDPALDNDGDALLTGALYWNTTTNSLKVYTGSAWSAAAFTLGDALSSIVQDTTPQLGGNLDLNGSDVTGTGNITVTGDINLTGDIDLTGNLTLSGDPTTALQAATKEYVDTIAAAGIHYHTPVRVESPTSLNGTYDNGSSGVGATLTNAGTLAALVVDGVSLSSADRVLLYQQSNSAHNGIYTVTTVGDGSTAWVLTRATDADSYGASDPDAMGEGDAFFVKEGDTGAGELYVMNTSGTITFGTTAITFTVIAETAVYSAGTNLSLTGTVFSISSATLNDIASTTPTIGYGLVGNGSTYVTTNSSTAAMLMPAGTTAERPTATDGMIRYNSDDAQFEGYTGGEWGAIAGGGGGDTQTVTTTSTTQTVVATYDKASYVAAEVLLVADNGTDRTITKLLIAHDNTTASATQYGEVNTNGALSSYDVDISGANVRILVTAAAATSTIHTAVASLIA